MLKLTSRYRYKAVNLLLMFQWSIVHEPMLCNKTQREGDSTRVGNCLTLRVL